MPTVVTKTVKPSGGDYTSLSAWEAGQQADLTASDTVQQAECYSMQDTAPLAIAGWTVDATRYARIYTPQTERHNGTRSAGKYRLEASANFDAAVKVGIPYCRIEGLQIKNTNANGTWCIDVNAAGTTDIRVDDTLFYDSAAGGGMNVDSASLASAANCIAMNLKGAGFAVGTAGSNTMYGYNCDAVNCGTYGFTCGSFRTMILKNCYAGGNTTADYHDAGNNEITVTTCFSSDGTKATSTAAFSTSSGCFFTSTTAGSEDLTLGVSSALIDAGTDLHADAHWLDPGGNVDIVGTARPQGAAWDVGPFEYVPAAGGTTITGSASLTGTGSLTGSGKQTATGASGLVGTGSLAATAKRVVYGHADLAGTGSISAAGTQTVHAAATLTGQGTLTAYIAGGTVTASATLTGTGSLSAAGKITRHASAVLTGLGTLTAAGVRIVLGSATLDGSGTLTASGKAISYSAATLAGTGHLAATGVHTGYGSATLAGAGTLTGIGRNSADATLAITVRTGTAGPVSGDTHVSTGSGLTAARATGGQTRTKLAGGS